MTGLLKNEPSKNDLDMAKEYKETTILVKLGSKTPPKLQKSSEVGIQTTSMLTAVLQYCILPGVVAVFNTLQPGNKINFLKCNYLSASDS